VDYRPVNGSPVKQGDDEVVLPRSSAVLALRLRRCVDSRQNRLLDLYRNRDNGICRRNSDPENFGGKYAGRIPSIRILAAKFADGRSP